MVPSYDGTEAAVKTYFRYGPIENRWCDTGVILEAMGIPGGAAAPSRQVDRLLLPLLARGRERAAHPTMPDTRATNGRAIPRDRSDAGVEEAHLPSNSSRGGRVAAKGDLRAEVGCACRG